MERFEYTQCSLNLANADAIVYRFANGEVSEIAVTDFDGDDESNRILDALMLKRELSDQEQYNYIIVDYDESKMWICWYLEGVE